MSISVYAHIRPDTAVEASLQTDKAGAYLVLSAGGLDIFNQVRNDAGDLAQYGAHRFDTQTESVSRPSGVAYQ